MRGIRTLATKQPSDLAGSSAALGLLDDPQPVLGGELAPGGLGHDLRVRCPVRLSGPGPGGSRRSAPRPPKAGASTSIHVMGSLSALIAIHHRRPPLIPRVPGVSTMSAREGERTASVAVKGEVMTIPEGVPRRNVRNNTGRDDQDTIELPRLCSPLRPGPPPPAGTSRAAGLKAATALCFGGAGPPAVYGRQCSSAGPGTHL